MFVNDRRTEDNIHNLKTTLRIPLDFLAYLHIQWSHIKVKKINKYKVFLSCFVFCGRRRNKPRNWLNSV